MVTKERRKDGGGEDVRGKEGNGVANARAAKLEVLETTDAKDFKVRVCRDTRDKRTGPKKGSARRTICAKQIVQRNAQDVHC